MTGALRFDEVLLEPEHLELLTLLAQAHRKTRQRFRAIRSATAKTGVLVSHPALATEDGDRISEEDLKTLAAEGFVRISYDIRGGFSFVVTPRGLRHYEEHSRPDDEERRKQLAQEIEAQRNLIVAVATGGPRIRGVTDEYVDRQHRIREGLASLGLEDPNPYDDLWEWYGKWSADLPTYQSRREYLRDLFAPVLEELTTPRRDAAPAREPTGWARVDRGLTKMRQALERAETEEDYQAVGLRGREVLISLAQAVYDPVTYRSLDGTEPSDTDAKRMLEAFIAKELPGSANEDARRHAKASLQLAVALQHDRSATFRDAALCLEATSSVVNVVAIVAGRRDSVDRANRGG